VQYTQSLETAASQSAAARLANHLRPLREQQQLQNQQQHQQYQYYQQHQQHQQHQQQQQQQTTTGNVTVIRATQQAASTVASTTPAATAAAAAAAVMAGGMTERGGKKSVRWSNALVSEVPMAMKASHKNNDDVPVNSILSVGGAPDYFKRFPSNSSNAAGFGDDGKAGRGGAELPTGTDSAAAVMMGSSTSLGGSTPQQQQLQRQQHQRGRGEVPATRPHTSGALEAGIMDRQAAVGGINGNLSQKNNAARHTPLLEMRRNQSQRPSLSEQLAAITADADALAKDIRAKGGLDKDDNPGDPVIVVLPAKSFSVGTLCCRYPSPTRYYRDRIEYTFHHPYENSEVHMTMYYCDMIQVALTGGRLKFKLPRRLVHFSSDFDPNNPTHVIAIELGTSAASTILREKIMPIINSGSGGLIGGRVRMGF
jgi:hypothetical protein